MKMEVIFQQHIKTFENMIIIKSENINICFIFETARHPYMVTILCTHFI